MLQAVRRVNYCTCQRSTLMCLCRLCSSHATRHAHALLHSIHRRLLTTCFDFAMAPPGIAASTAGARRQSAKCIRWIFRIHIRGYHIEHDASSMTHISALSLPPRLLFAYNKRFGSQQDPPPTIVRGIVSSAGGSDTADIPRQNGRGDNSSYEVIPSLSLRRRACWTPQRVLRRDASCSPARRAASDSVGPRARRGPCIVRRHPRPPPRISRYVHMTHAAPSRGGPSWGWGTWRHLACLAARADADWWCVHRPLGRQSGVSDHFFLALPRWRSSAC